MRMACSTSRLAVGSSRRMKSGCIARLRAIATRWRSPPESVLTARSRRAVMPHHFHRVVDRLAIGCSCALETSAVRVASHGDDFIYREWKIETIVLRNECDPLRDRLAVE